MTEKNNPATEAELTDDQLTEVSGGVNINQSHYIDPTVVNTGLDLTTEATVDLAGGFVDPLAININNDH